MEETVSSRLEPEQKTLPHCSANTLTAGDLGPGLPRSVRGGTGARESCAHGQQPAAVIRQGQIASHGHGRVRPLNKAPFPYRPVGGKYGRGENWGVGDRNWKSWVLPNAPCHAPYLAWQLIILQAHGPKPPLTHTP
ncbi:hypothetical protein KUCAC02_012264 [Chaenocephalus aceratus]|uniref:Uncharacterized protein n=1 Tax=Chaenocephalus aceratus TaxID=36190 RepID=A0ACB9XC39_CHAAC|nr:hypothetical protein KUCAC02_012264 [Chaenocephalus aceratus]